MSFEHNKIEETFEKSQFIEKISQLIVKKANESIEKNGKFSFVLSGGSTPKDIFINLAQKYKNNIDWTKVHFFWLDERCVDPNHEDSNYKLAYAYLISKLDKVGSVNRMKGEIESKQAASEYEDTLLDFFGKDEISFDFILLGMGEDGHVASLFPDTQELKQKDKIVLSTEEKHNGFYRITLGSKIINNSKFNLLILKGETKYEKYKESNISMLPKDIIEFDKILVFL